MQSPVPPAWRGRRGTGEKFDWPGIPGEKTEIAVSPGQKTVRGKFSAGLFIGTDVLGEKTLSEGVNGDNRKIEAFNFPQFCFREILIGNTGDDPIHAVIDQPAHGDEIAVPPQTHHDRQIIFGKKHLLNALGNVGKIRGAQGTEQNPDAPRLSVERALRHGIRPEVIGLRQLPDPVRRAPPHFGIMRKDTRHRRG